MSQHGITEPGHCSRFTPYVFAYSITSICKHCCWHENRDFSAPEQLSSPPHKLSSDVSEHALPCLQYRWKFQQFGHSFTVSAQKSLMQFSRRILLVSSVIMVASIAVKKTCEAGIPFGGKKKEEKQMALNNTISTKKHALPFFAVQSNHSFSPSENA
jgi:hypothetical protein